MLVEPAALVADEVLDPNDIEILFGKAFAKDDPFLLLRHDQCVGVIGNRAKLLGRGAPVGRFLLDPEQLLALQPGNPCHEEFVEVGARNRQESQPLEQRMGGVLRFLQHPPIKGLTPAHAARSSAISPAWPSARRITGMVSRARSDMAKRSTASTVRSALQ